MLSRRLLTLINAGQTYTINSSYAFRFRLIGLRNNTLVFFYFSSVTASYIKVL